METETLKSLFYRIPTAEIAKPRTQNPLFNISIHIDLFIIFWVLLKKLFFFLLKTMGNRGVRSYSKRQWVGPKIPGVHQERECAARHIPMMDWDLDTCSIVGPSQRSGPMGLYRTVLSQHMTRLEHCDTSHVRPKIPALSKF